MSYAVLKKGHIEIYDSKEMYEQGENMKQRIKLQDLRLTVKLKEFHHDYSSFNLVRRYNCKESVCCVFIIVVHDFCCRSSL